MEYGDEPFVSYGQLGSASMQDMVSDDDANLPSTPTPKSMNQKRLEKSLTKLKLLTPYGSRVEGKPLIDSCKPSQRVSSGPVHEPPKEPIDVLKPASTSLQKPMAIEDVQPTETPSASLQIPASEPELPTSRLDCISRLIKSFWKSSTVLDALRSANPGLDTILENSEDTRGYLQHMWVPGAIKNSLHQFSYVSRPTLCFYLCDSPPHHQRCTWPLDKKFFIRRWELIDAQSIDRSQFLSRTLEELLPIHRKFWRRFTMRVTSRSVVCTTGDDETETGEDLSDT